MKKAKTLDTFDQALFEDIQQEFVRIKEEEISGLRGKAPKMVRMNNLVDHYFLLNKFRLYTRFLTYSNFLKGLVIDLSEEDFSILIDYINRNRDFITSIPVLYAYLKTSELIQSDYRDGQVVENLAWLSKFVVSHPKSISLVDQIDILSILANFCTKGLNLGYTDLKPLTFEINIKMINIKYGEKWDKSPLPLGIFKNTIVSAIALNGEINWSQIDLYGVQKVINKNFVFDWVNSFLAYYHKRLRSAEKKTYVEFCKAYNLFWKGDGLGAIFILAKLNSTKRDFINLDIKMLLQMCIFQIEKEANPDNLKVVRRLKLNLKVISEAYRKQVEYYENQKGNLNYQLLYHKSFRIEFEKMVKFYNKYSGTKRSSSMEIDFNKNKYELLKCLKDIKYPFANWMKLEIEKLK